MRACRNPQQTLGAAILGPWLVIPACSSIETWDGQRGQPFRRGPRNKCTTFGTLAACEARGSRFAGRPCSCPVALLADRQQLLIAVGLRKGGCVPNNTPVIKAAQASQAHCRKYVVRCLARTPPCSVIQIRELCRISYGVCDSWPRSGVDVTRGESACARLPVRCQKQSPQLLRGCVRASRRRQSSRADGAPGRGGPKGGPSSSWSYEPVSKWLRFCCRREAAVWRRRRRRRRWWWRHGHQAKREAARRRIYHA